MSTTVNVFRLPRPSLTGNPRLVSKRLRLAPKAEPEPDLIDPLAGWEPGFSNAAAMEHLVGMGGSLPDRPEVDPTMPSDVTLLGSDELGTLHAQFVAFTEWLESRLALAEIDATEAEAYLEHVEAEIRLRKAGTVKDKDSKTKNDTRYVNEQRQQLIANAKKTLLRARVKGYERCAAALSREMTRRAPQRLPE